MSYRIVSTKEFEREIKKLSKKHYSLRNDFARLLSALSDNPMIGSPIGNECFKIRLLVKSKSTWKSGGARVITCVKIILNTVILVSIYDKSEKATISDFEIKERLKKYLAGYE